MIMESMGGASLRLSEFCDMDLLYKLIDNWPKAPACPP